MKFKINPHHLYIGLVGIFFLATIILFIFFPRPVYSELEKRDLTEFPQKESFMSNPSQFTGEISKWFSDTEPFRDELMTFSMWIRDRLRLRIGKDEDIITFRQVAEDNAEETDIEEQDIAHEDFKNPLANENAKIAGSGIIIVGTGPNVRALMVYGGSPKASEKFITMVKDYSTTFPDLSVYVLVAPLATEFYLPDKVRKNSNPELPTLQYIKENLGGNIKFIDVYNALESHADEDIYFRTDHHWTPLGAFYAAQAFAKMARVDFKPLENYQKKSVKDFVGTMYSYSKDISLKNNPEDFIYYEPQNIKYETSFITYNLNKNFQIVSESKPFSSSFFKKYKDGASGAYSTFMGGDRMIAKVTTDNKSSRKLLIIKDSYGNAIPGYLFYSFDEIHVVDFRYFTKNMTSYIRDNKITDLLFAFNIFNVCSSSSMKKVQNFLTQKSHLSNVDTQKETKTEDENNNIRPNNNDETNTPDNEHDIENNNKAPKIENELKEPEAEIISPSLIEEKVDN